MLLGAKWEGWQNGNALVSKTSGRKPLEVRVLYPPPGTKFQRNFYLAIACKLRDASANKSMQRILIGILIVVAGAIITTKANWIYENLGGVAWAEEHLGTEGGSRLFYKLLGILIIFLGFLVISGLWYDLLNSIAGIFGIKSNY